MPSHAELAGKLLADAAGFFKTLGDQNPEIQKNMSENASVFEKMAELVSTQPEGIINGQTHGALAGRLLQDAAQFFRTLAEQNEPIREQMNENANVYDQIGALVSKNPNGILD